MPSKKLMGAFAFFQFLTLVAGVIALVFSIIWRGPNLLLNMVFSHVNLTAGTVLGVFMMATFVLSVGAIVQRNHVTVGLVALNWMLIADAVIVIVIGSMVWLYTLQQRNNYHKVFSGLSTQTRIEIQDKLHCCGYFNSSDLAEVGGNFCANQTFITTTNNATGNFCVGPITAFANTTLNDVFTSVYGYMAVIIGLFFASLCVINKRKEEERFKKIDAKRGGKGFV